MISAQADLVKRQVAAHWNRRAANFDEDFGHSIRTPAERAAWDRIVDLALPAAGVLEALDIGCGTGFLSLELASRGHRVTGVDFAPSMIAQARKKVAERRAAIRYEEADAEQLPFTRAMGTDPPVRVPAFVRPRPFGSPAPVTGAGSGGDCRTASAGNRRSKARKSGFALDSPVEGDGFEPSVPRLR